MVSQGRRPGACVCPQRPRLGLYGQGIAQDHATAASWYRKAADQGYAAAQFNLGLMYANGQGVPQDHATSASWYRKAADQGEAKALSPPSAWMYQNGQGVTQNDVQAYMWYNLAVSRFPASDKENLDLRSQSPKRISREDDFRADRGRAEAVGALLAIQLCGLRITASCSPRGKNRTRPPPTPRNEVASTGTGFFVSEAGHIVTNAHVVEGCQTVRSSRGGPLRKVSVDEESDLALYIASEKTDAIARLRGGRGARAGESVVAVGFPLSGLLSSDPIVTTGIISALSGLRNDRRTIQITAPVQPGNSGGPLLGENGSVVGVVVSKLNAVKVAEAIGDIPQNVNFAVSAGTLQSFLNANSVPYALDDSKATKTPADITAEATRYTVLLECLR